MVAVMGRFNREDADRMHILPLVDTTLPWIRICMWLERLVALLKKKGKTDCPDFCDMKGYMLSMDAIGNVFCPILEETQIHRYRNLAEYIPRGLNV